MESYYAHSRNICNKTKTRDYQSRMGVQVKNKQPHAVLVPFPSQGHLNPLLKLAKILHRKGYHITFVYTEYIYACLVRARGVDSMKGLPSFTFETIHDGVPMPADPKDLRPSLGSRLVLTNHDRILASFKELLSKLSDASINLSSNVPPVSCIISDGIMNFTIDAAEEMGISNFLFSPMNATATFACTQRTKLVENGYILLKGESYMTNELLDTQIEFMPMMNGAHLRVRDLPTYLVNEKMAKDGLRNFVITIFDRAQRATGFLVNTFENLETDAMKALRSIQPSTYAIGPLNLVDELQSNDDNHNHKDILAGLGSNMWKIEDECLEWLDTKEPNSVLFVNFGTTAIMDPDQLAEFAWGLANSNQAFLLILSGGIIGGNESSLPLGFLESTKEQGMVATWCPQDKVLAHNAIAGFLNHGGWNSVLESMCNGVPMICWPSYADQYTCSWNCCNQWGVGMEINIVKRDIVERLVKDLVVGDKGKEMKKRAMNWKIMFHQLAKDLSLENLDKLAVQ